MVDRDARRRVPSNRLGSFTQPAGRLYIRWLVIPIAICGVAAVAIFAFAREPRVRSYQVEIVNTYPHDRHAFCQGLAFHDGVLYEGTGKTGESQLRQVEIETGKVVRHVPIGRQHFGEGITVWKDRIYQLTWTSGLAFVYDRKSFKRIRTLPYSGQGWGLTHDGTHLIMSDGTPVLRFLDPETFRSVKRLTVTRQGRLVQDLNELEYVDDEIWANVWYEDYVLRISPRTGIVLGFIDLASLYPQRERPRENVLNGIAYDSTRQRIFVTGKNWPHLFEIKLVPE